MTRTSCALCPAGSACNGTSIITVCPGGTFSSETGASNCTECADGTTSSAGATQCEFCLAGTYLSPTGGCVECGVDNEWSSNKAAHCQVCPVGSFTSGGTFTTRTSCSECPAGSACNGTSIIEECAAGTFSSETGASNCTVCPDGTTSSAGATQ